MEEHEEQIEQEYLSEMIKLFNKFDKRIKIVLGFIIGIFLLEIICYNNRLDVVRSSGILHVVVYLLLGITIILVAIIYKYRKENYTNLTVNDRVIKRYKKGYEFYDMISVIPIFLFVVSCLNIFVSPTTISGISMEPTFVDGQHILVWNINREYNRFDIVIVDTYDKLENDDERYFIKRVIGLPGERVEYIDNDLYINGVKYEEDFLMDSAGNKPVTCGDGNCTFVVPMNSYFVLGDNRYPSYKSYDSEELGAFVESNLIGKVKVVVTPWSEFEVFE